MGVNTVVCVCITCVRDPFEYGDCILDVHGMLKLVVPSSLPYTLLYEMSCQHIQGGHATAAEDMAGAVTVAVVVRVTWTVTGAGDANESSRLTSSPVLAVPSSHPVIPEYHAVNASTCAKCPASGSTSPRALPLPSPLYICHMYSEAVSSLAISYLTRLRAHRTTHLTDGPRVPRLPLTPHQ